MPTLNRPWGRMAYQQSTAAGLTLLFLHGTACDSEDCQPVFAQLSADLRWISLDYPGHGHSDAPHRPICLDDLADDALALIEHLGVDRAVLVGHSLGGIAAMAAAQRSDRVRALVLLEGWTNRRAAEAYSGARLYGRLDPQAIAIIERKSREVVARFDPEVWRRFSDSVGAFDGWPYLSQARIPIYEVYGDLGRTARTLELLSVPGNPHIRMRWIARAGHYLPHEKPGEVACICAEAAREIQSVGA